MYSQYCTNQPAAVATLNENVAANSRLRGARLRALIVPLTASLSDFLQAQMASSMNQNLASYLIRPVQRLCKYPLLLRVRTSADHPLPSYSLPHRSC